MMLEKIKSYLCCCWQWIKGNFFTIFLIGLSFGLIGWGLYHAETSKNIIDWGSYDISDSKTPAEKSARITVQEWIAFIISITGIILLAIRAQNQGKQIEIQIEQNTDAMFNAAVTLLGSDETSARTGAIYSLYHLAIESKKYRGQIAQILCSHIRSKTREKKYQEDNSEKPSNEIQTAINLLFRNVSGQKGLYCKFISELPKADLSHAYLVWANFSGAYYHAADFRMAHCEGADFNNAHCEEADFQYAHCKGAIFSDAYCEGANFKKAHCEGANFSDSHCEGACFDSAHCEGADFNSAHCEGTDFRYAHCQETNFLRAHCEGANFEVAHCEKAYFLKAHCEGANFRETHCQGGRFNHAFFQGTYAGKNYQGLSSRINKETQIDEMIILGTVSEESINNIERAQKEAERFLPENWYFNMKNLIDENKGLRLLYCRSGNMPAGIKTGVLENSKELRALIEKLEKIEKRKEPHGARKK